MVISSYLFTNGSSALLLVQRAATSSKGKHNAETLPARITRWHTRYCLDHHCRMHVCLTVYACAVELGASLQHGRKYCSTCLHPFRKRLAELTAEAALTGTSTRRLQLGLSALAVQVGSRPQLQAGRPMLIHHPDPATATTAHSEATTIEGEAGCQKELSLPAMRRYIAHAQKLLSVCESLCA